MSKTQLSAGDFDNLHKVKYSFTGKCFLELKIAIKNAWLRYKVTNNMQYSAWSTYLIVKIECFYADDFSGFT